MSYKCNEWQNGERIVVVLERGGNMCIVREYKRVVVAYG